MNVRPEHRQRAHRVRLEWGPGGAAMLSADCAAVVVVVSAVAPRMRGGVLA